MTLPRFELDNMKHHRPIRSFVKREGRMTRAQSQALEKLLPVYGVPDKTPVDFDRLFGRTAPRYLEIGFGMGTSLLVMAENHPENDYLGIEVHRPGVGKTLIELHQKALGNLKIINHDAIEILNGSIPEESLDGVYVFFPDPWQKKKHHKRRMVQDNFIHQIHRILKPGGVFHLVTDWEDYAHHIMDVMTRSDGFTNTTGKRKYASRGDRPETKYERRGRRLGHVVRDLVFNKV